MAWANSGLYPATIINSLSGGSNLANWTSTSNNFFLTSNSDATLYAAALDDYASLAETVMADSRTAAEARAGAERTRRAFELLWDEAAGVYVDAADRNGPRRRSC